MDARFWILLIVVSLAACTRAADQPRAALPRTSWASERSAAAPRGDVVSPAPSRQVPVTSSSAPALEAFERGRRLAEEGHEKEAASALRHALVLDERCALAHAALGELTPGPAGAASIERAVALAVALPEAERLTVEQIRAAYRGDSGRAVELGRRIATIVPDDWRVHFRLGAELMRLGRSDEASAAFERACQLEPDAVQARRGLAAAYARQHRHDDAVRTAQAYLRAAPDDPARRDAVGEALLVAGRLDEAEVAFRGALEVEPRHWRSWQGVAQTRFLRGRWRSGLDALAKARAATTEPAERIEIDEDLAWAHLSRGKTAQAVMGFLGAERDAREHRLVAAEHRAALDRAFALYEAGSYQDALDRVSRTIVRLDTAGLAPLEALRLRSWALTTKMLVHSSRHERGHARRTLAALERLTSMSPHDAASRSAAQLGRGLLAWANGSRTEAASQLAGCDANDALCALTMIEAAQRAGDDFGAGALRRNFESRYRRDRKYLFVHAKLEASRRR